MINLLVVGVGGQGTILASKIIAEVALREGLDVKMSEIHGMAQRGGSVVTHIKFGKKVYSPLVAKGEAQFILAFEELEALRWLSYLAADGLLIMNEQQLNPLPVLMGKALYPQDNLAKIQEMGCKVASFKAIDIANRLGNARVFNLVLLGELAKHLSFSREQWEKVIEDTVPERFLDVNLQAFTIGYKS